MAASVLKGGGKLVRSSAEIAMHRELCRARVDAQHLRRVARDAVHVTVTPQHPALPLVARSRRRRKRPLELDRAQPVRAGLNPEHAASVTGHCPDGGIGRVPVGYAPSPVLTHVPRHARGQQPHRLRGCVDAEHGVRVGWGPNNEVTAARTATPLAAAARKVAHLTHFPRLRHDLQRRRRVVGHPPDSSVAGLDAAVPLLPQPRMQHRADEGGAAAGGVNLEHTLRVGRDGVYVAVVSMHAIAPLPLALWQLAFTQHRQLPGGTDAQNRVGARRNAEDAAVRRWHTAQPLEGPLRHLCRQQAHRL